MSERGKPGRKATWPRRVSVLDRSGSDVGSKGDWSRQQVLCYAWSLEPGVRLRMRELGVSPRGSPWTGLRVQGRP